MEDIFSVLQFPKSVNVTDQEINLSQLSDIQRETYINLFKKIINLYLDQQENRFIIGIAGPTGAGKSVVTAILKNLSEQLDKRFAFTVLTIDAFHYTNSTLASKITRTGELLKEHKGRFDTYDVEKLEEALSYFRRGDSVNLPGYSRKLHDPIPNDQKIVNPRALLIIEGLWLLHKKHGWEKIYKYLDYTIFIDADKQKVKAAVLKRHEEGGKTVAQATAHYNNVDGLNFDLVMESRPRAKLIIPPYYEI